MNFSETLHYLLEQSRAGRFASRYSSSRAIRRSIYRCLNGRRDRPKVFCVGWVKTATTSFGVSMRHLGFRHLSFDVDIYRKWWKRRQVEKLLNYAAYFDSFDDLPWNEVELITRCRDYFPESYWVMLERSPEDWLNSYVRFQLKQGKPAPNKDACRRLLVDFVNRNNNVIDELSGCRLLRMNIFAGDGYNVLCPFLGLPICSEPFPVSNVNALSQEGYGKDLFKDD